MEAQTSFIVQRFQFVLSDRRNVTAFHTIVACHVLIQLSYIAHHDLNWFIGVNGSVTFI